MRLWYCRGILDFSTLIPLIAGLAVPSLLFLYDYPRLAGIAAIYLFYPPLALYMRVSRFARKNSKLQQPTRLTYSALKLKLETADSMHQIEWQNFEGWIETRGYFFLIHRNDSLDLIVPKRAFNPNQLADFTKLMALSLP